MQLQADTPKDVLATAYFARSTKLVAQTAEVLGKKEDAPSEDQAETDQPDRRVFHVALLLG